MSFSCIQARRLTQRVERQAKSEREALTAYMLGVVEVNDQMKLESRIHNQYNDIIQLLGDKSGLIAEFTEC